MSSLAADTASWFVATKLHPPRLRSDTLPRPHLEEALRRSVSTLPVTLLSAPAGYGKTTLLAALPHLLPDLPLAWVTLDAEENDPIRFIGLLATACQGLHPDCGRSVWPWLSAAADAASLKRAVGALINDVLTCLPHPFVLVLDDLHFVTEPAVFVALEYLLDHQPTQMRIALGTRHDPPLRLARLAVRRQLCELRRPDLGFTPAEAAQLLNGTLGLSLSPTEVAALQERTEGWPAGLCLLAGPLGRLGSEADRTQFLAAISQMERYALDFLAEEVLRDLDQAVRRFLLETSILAEMSPSICRAVTGRADAGEFLERLYRQNLTIASLSAAPSGEAVYRHHALFARLLARQLERELPGEIAQLHRRAAEVQPNPGRAIAHYLAAGLWDEAVRLMIASTMQLLHRGMYDTVRHWYSALPREVAAAQPLLTVLVARCEIHRGDYAAAGQLLGQARAACLAAGDAAGEAEAITSLITIAYRNGDRPAARAYVARAAQLPMQPMGRMATGLVAAWLHLADGNWAEALAALREALAISTGSSISQIDMVGIPYIYAPLAALSIDLTEQYCAEAAARTLPQTVWRLGADEIATWLTLWRGRFADALARTEAAEALRQTLGGYPFIGCEVPAQMAVLYAARGDLAAAVGAAQTLLDRLPGSGPSKWPFYLHAAGRALALAGRRAEAHGVWQRLTALDDGAPLTHYLSLHLAGLLALLEGRHAEAAETLADAAGLEAEIPVAWVGGSARLLQARLSLDLGKPLPDVAALLAGWVQAGLPGAALLDGPLVLPVLQALARRGDEAAAQLLHCFPGPSPTQALAPATVTPAHPPLIDPLTQREQDVLKLVVAGRTNRQIGEELYITEETVKTHVVRILRKLEVTSRTQAAVRGRELGY